MTGTIWTARPSAAEVAAVRELSPLAADLAIGCGPFEVSSGVLASSTTLEDDDTDEGRIARQFVEDHPFDGMGSVSPGGWMLLARDDDTVVLGQRHDRVGLGKIVVLTRREDGFRMASMGGCRPLAPEPTHQVEVSFHADVDGSTVTARWMNGQNLEGIPDRLLSHVQVLEAADAVHFLIYSKPNPEYPSGNQLGTGRGDTATFSLAAPLGGRALYCDQRVPPILVQVRERGGERGDIH